MFRKLFLAGCLLTAGLVVAQDAMVTVRKEGARKETISISGLQVSGKQAQIFKQTLEGDLQRSGWFKLGAAGSINVNGSVRDSGAGIVTACDVVGTRKRFNWTRTSSEAEVRRQAHELCDAIIKHLLGETGIASTQIAVVKNNGPNQADLYVCDADGYNARRLTGDNKAIVGPRWDPTGRTIYFTSYRSNAPVLYKINAAGGGLSTFMRFPGLNTGAAISPDGTKAALILSYQGNPELYCLELAANRLIRLTQTKLAAEASPCWSPDGRSIVYVSDPRGAPHLYIVDVATKASRRLTYNGSENVNPSWGANGLICFATRRGSSYQVAVMDPAKGEASTQIVGNGESPSWGADGRHILCSRPAGGQTGLYMLDILGDPEVRLTRFQGNWICPNWSSR